MAGVLDRAENEKISNLLALSQYATLKPHDVFYCCCLFWFFIIYEAIMKLII